MIQVLFTVGVVGGFIIISGLLLAIIIHLPDEISERLHQRRLRKWERAYRNSSIFLAVRIPCKKYNFTPVAYICGRKKGPPVVTILDKDIFDKLPHNSVLIPVAGNHKFLPEVRNAWGLRALLRDYNCSLESILLDPNI